MPSAGRLGALRGVVTAHRVTWEEYRAATDWLMSAGQQGFVGAVKESLVTPVAWHDDHGDRRWATCSYDFVLPPAD